MNKMIGKISDGTTRIALFPECQDGTPFYPTPEQEEALLKIDGVEQVGVCSSEGFTEHGYYILICMPNLYQACECMGEIREQIRLTLLDERGSE